MCLQNEITFKTILTIKRFILNNTYLLHAIKKKIFLLHTKTFTWKGRILKDICKEKDDQIMTFLSFF